MTDNIMKTELNILNPSEWQCHLFGVDGYILRPAEGDVPNWFWRWTQRVVFGNRWEKVKPE